MNNTVDHNKFRLGAWGSTLLSGTAGLDLTGSSAKVYICAITTLTDHDVESTFRTEFLKNLVQMSDAKRMSNIGTSQRMMRLTTNPLQFFENFGADAGKELNQLESQSRAILSAAGAYDAQSIMIGGKQETNISANQDVIQGSASVLSTDTNLQYHFGSAIPQ